MTFIFLKYKIETMKITQEQIAQATGLSTGSVSELFNGKQPGGNVIRQLVTFGLEPCLVVSGTNEEIIESLNALMSLLHPEQLSETPPEMIVSDFMEIDVPPS